MTPNAPDAQTKTYRVTGMTCGGCAKSLSQAIARSLPELHFEVSVEHDSLTVTGAHDLPRVQEAVESAGFDFGGALA